MQEVNKQVGNQWVKRTNLQQAIVLLISILFGVNGYKGPVFDNYIGDLIALCIMVITYYQIRKLDYMHKESTVKTDLEILKVNLEITKLKMVK